MSADSLYQQLCSNLAFLRLQAAAEALPGARNAREDTCSHGEFLKALTDVEVAATAERRRASLERFAKLPASWSIADFDFAAQPSVDGATVRESGPLRAPRTGAPDGLGPIPRART